jgi:alpha-beta hydrolase superfamily lysophospholipase
MDYTLKRYFMILSNSIVFGEYQLSGVLYNRNSNASACIIMCHGFQSSKDSSKYVAISEESYKRGFSSLRFDFRGCGDSGGSLRETTLSGRILDLKSAIDYIENKSSKIFLMGSSLGGCVSILTAAEDSRIKGVVAWATPAHFNFPREKNHINNDFFHDAKRFDILKKVTNLSCPLLIIHGNQDMQVPVSHANALFEKATEPKLIKIFEEADHRFTNSTVRIKAIDLTLDWFEKHLN